MVFRADTNNLCNFVSINLNSYIHEFKSFSCKMQKQFFFFTEKKIGVVNAHLCSMQKTGPKMDGQFRPSPVSVMGVIWSVFTKLSCPSSDAEDGAVPLEIVGKVLNKIADIRTAK